MTALHSHHRTSLTIGWEAARANLAPALLIQVVMLALLAGFYLSPAAAAVLNDFAALKMRNGFTFVVVAAVAAGALLPELFLIVFFQRGRPAGQNLRNLLFTVPIWAIDGSLVDLLYRSEAAWHAQVDAIPNHRIVFIEHSRHFVMLDQPDAFYGALDEFFAGK